jgi:tetratricopeptide (TPR) repeat protein
MRCPCPFAMLFLASHSPHYSASLGYTLRNMNHPSTDVDFRELRVGAAIRRILLTGKPTLYFLLALVLLLSGLISTGRCFQSSDLSGASLQQDYDAAESAHATGNLSQAATDYKLFLTHAFNLLGNNFGLVGDYTDANALFDEGLILDPTDLEMRLDYAQESVAAGDLPKAEQLAEEAVQRNPRDASARLSLGRVLLQMKQNIQAKQQFDAAVALNPNYVNGLALVRVDLVLKDEKSAATILAEMLKGFGDSARLHMDFGLAYAETGYPEQAIAQFKAAIAKNGRLPGAHYSLGAAYLQSMGEIDFPLAEAEFKKELTIAPNDFLSYSQLGYIALAEHRFPDAGKDLTQAATLNPEDPDVFLFLGQLYTQMKEPEKAEAAFKRSISLTRDVSHNHYQVQRAHYLLARLLLESGKTTEGTQQMQISQDLMKKIVRQTQGKADASPRPELPSSNTPKAKTLDAAENQKAIQQAKAYESKISPAIADSYNNLGVISASAGDFPGAVRYFQSAANWNPQLPGIDYNLGKAAYYASQYQVAIPPLQRYVQQHPQDEQPRLWLAKILAEHRP